MTNTKSVDVSPTKEFFVEAITRDISIESCITDLIDNAIDGIRRGGETSNYQAYYINITFNKNKFFIEDNCGGISIDNAETQAFVLGNSKQKIQEDQVSGFGIGMKRAFFKLGRQIEVKSSTHKDKIRVAIDVDKWLKEERWEFILEEDQNIANKIGTSIKIEKLNESVKTRLKEGRYEQKLRQLIEQKYEGDIDKGLRININNKLIISKDNKREVLYTKSKKVDRVNIEVVIERGEKNREDSGWYIELNDKCVIFRDKGKLTGWGAVHKSGKQTLWEENLFDESRGRVSARAKNPLDLPYTTTKDGINQDHKIYDEIVELMISATYECKKKFQPSGTKIISYSKPVDEIEMLKKKLQVKYNREVGIITYDEYLKKIRDK